MGAEHAGEPGKDGMFRVLTSTMRVLKPNEVCTHSYFVIGPFEEALPAENLLGYLQTKFVRFLIMQCMSAVNLSKAVFSLSSPSKISANLGQTKNSTPNTNWMKTK